jgi:hypothetical protein
MNLKLAVIDNMFVSEGLPVQQIREVEVIDAEKSDKQVLRLDEIGHLLALRILVTGDDVRVDVPDELGPVVEERLFGLEAVNMATHDLTAGLQREDILQERFGFSLRVEATNC